MTPLLNSGLKFHGTTRSKHGLNKLTVFPFIFINHQSCGKILKS